MYRRGHIGGIDVDVINCKGCGRLFNALTRSRLCPNCVTKMEEKFQEVKTYVNDNPGSTIEIVSQECGVSTKQIKQWIREERLSFSEDSMQGIECEQCGAMIRCGRFCESCKSKLHNDFRGAIDTPVARPEKNTSRDKDRMRFLQGL